MKDHYIQLRELESDYAAFYEYIDSVNDEVQKYMSHIPRFERDFIGMFGEAFNESSAILDQPKIQKYSWLRHAVNKMQVWSENTDILIAPARNKYDAFERGRARVEELLVLTKETIEANKSDIEQAWSWGKKETLPRLNAKAQSFDRKERDWDRLIKRNWAEYNITRAISECENLIQFCEGKIFEVTQMVEKMYQNQFQLDDKVKEIERLLENNPYELSLQDQDQITALVNIAKETVVYDYAVKLLNYAYSLAIRKTTPQGLREIQKIIVNSGGGPVFMAKVINRGKIAGAQRFTQNIKPRGRKRNAKKR